MASLSLTSPQGWFKRGKAATGGVQQPARPQAQTQRKGLGDLQALILISVLFMIPITLLSYQKITDDLEKIRVVRLEARGDKYIDNLYNVESVISIRRSLLVQLHGGGASVKAAVDKSNGALAKAVQELDAYNAQTGVEMKVQDLIAQLKARMTLFDAELPTMSPQQAYEEQTALITMIGHIADNVISSSALDLDPTAESYHLIQSSTIAVPALRRELIELLEMGRYLIAKGEVTANDRGAYIVLRASINANIEQTLQRYDATFDASANIREKLKPTWEKGQRDVAALLALTDREFEPGRKIAISAADWVKRASAVVAGISVVGEHGQDAGRELLGDLFQSQDKALVRGLAIVVGINLLAITLAIFGAVIIGRRLLASIREREERAAMDAETNRRNQAAILRLMDELGPLSDGDFTKLTTVDEEITGAIADSVNVTVTELRKLVQGVNDTAGLVTKDAASAAKISDQLRAVSNKQAEEIKNASSAVDMMTRSIGEVAANATQSADVARKSLVMTQQGAAAAQESIKNMNAIRDQIQDTSKRIKRLGESSQEIGEIVELIGDITEQTNVLALNAAIQAATAGEAGRGFAVVAEEVQRLAERSAEATRQIGAIVKTIQTDTQDAVAAMEKSTEGVVEGAKLSDRAGEALIEITKVTNELSENIQSIAISTEMQVDIAKEVTQGMTQTLTMTEEATAGTNQTAEVIKELSASADALRGSVVKFKV